MNKFIILSLLCTGCSGAGVFLRYNYNRALENLPPCSKVHTINNDYITYSMIEASTNSVFITYTNYYRAYYTGDGYIYKTVKANAN
jgi:hypothetical protein